MKSIVNLMKKLFNYFLGASLMVFAGMADLLFLAAVAIVILEPFSYVSLALVAVALWLWVRSPMKPFMAWKPSNIKAFWKNWNNICQ